MVGGTWTSQNKVRPGAYANVRSENVAGSADGISGIVTLPISLDFGIEKQIVEVNSGTNFDRLFGHGLGSDELLLVNEALKRASTVLLYRVNSGTKASGSIAEEVTATAKYGGSKGNDIRIVVQVNVDESDKFNVLTYLDSVLMDTQEAVETGDDLVNNDLVDFSGSGNLETTAGVTLSGGETSSATSGDYADYFEAVSVYEFNTLAIPVEEEATKVAGANFVRRLRDEEGQKCQVVVANYRANHEAVVNVKNGVVLSNGKQLSAAQATAWVSGATAAAAVNESLTYLPYDGAVDVQPRFSNTDTIAALRAGEFLFTQARDQARVEQDINSLTTFTTSKNQDFRKNRILRVLDDIANNSKEVFLNNFVGRVDNNEDGRALFLANRIAYFEGLQDINAIENFAADDVTIAAGEEKDAVVMDAYVQPVDSMEKLYMTVRVQ